MARGAGQGLEVACWVSSLRGCLPDSLWAGDESFRSAQSDLNFGYPTTWTYTCGPWQGPLC